MCDFLVEALKYVRALEMLEMLVVLAGQAVEGQRLADVGFDPVSDLGIPLLPEGELRLEGPLGLRGTLGSSGHGLAACE